MMSKNPFGWISIEVRIAVFNILLLLTIVLIASLQLIGAPLRTQAARTGIVSFELAGTMSEANRILDSWDADQRILAGISLGLDYLFLFAYASTIGLACTELGSRLHERLPILKKLGFILAWVVIAAACLDAAENYALIRILIGKGSAFLTTLARWSATLKFGMVALGLLYCIGAAVVYRLFKRAAP